jgi:RNA polymerase sigma factor (TIGR02999 family)
MSDVTRLIDAAATGDHRAAAELLPLVYDELRQLAAARLAAEPAGHTLQPTALVHEAYLRLVGEGRPSDWNGRPHFFAAAAAAMRRILIDKARRKHSLKHGGGCVRINLDEALMVGAEPPPQLFELTELLDRLAVADPSAARLVHLRFFAGLTSDQAADVLGISPRSADHLWAYARAWLFEKLQGLNP